MKYYIAAPVEQSMTNDMTDHASITGITTVMSGDDTTRNLRFTWYNSTVHGMAIAFIGTLYYINKRNFEEGRNIIDHDIFTTYLPIIITVLAITSVLINHLLIKFRLSLKWKIVLVYYYSIIATFLNTASIFLLEDNGYAVKEGRIYLGEKIILSYTGFMPTIVIVFEMYYNFQNYSLPTIISVIDKLIYILVSRIRSLNIGILIISAPLLMFVMMKKSIENEVNCPTDEKRFFPCTCNNIIGEYKCEGASVTEDSINQFFIAIREVNYGSSEEIKIPSFYINNTNLLELDMSYLFNINFNTLSIINNPYLTTLHSSTIHNLSIVAYDIDLSDNNLDDQGISTLFVLFAPIVRYISLSGNCIQGSLSQSEFIPGLSLLTNLRELHLDFNYIRRVGGGQFRKNKWLKIINLSNNRIHEIGSKAFIFDHHGEDSILKIDLSFNHLSDLGINDDSFISIGRPTKLVLKGNQFEYITENNFLDFIRSDVQNLINFSENVFVCDEKMIWLKIEKDLLKTRMLGIQCSNYAGYNVFDPDRVIIM